MHVIATAGHVDHGKSTLVRLLTGMEPDRWAEERRRGLTIDLGFAWTTLPDGSEIAFVDVPGHRKFVPNMLSGIGPVPAVMFVVAADSGWMPQSTEHLAALDAMRIEHGLLVITRADLASPERALAESRERLAPTSLASMPHVVASGTSGFGLDSLRSALSALAERLPPPDTSADVRLWVDRSFSVSGVGTVVTGTLAAGSLCDGDELLLNSSLATVRGLQSLGRKESLVSSIARVAVSLRGVDRDSVRRGDALLTPNRWLAVSTVDVVVSVPLPSRMMLHIGSAAVPVTVRPLGTVAARLTLSRPLPLRIGDRVLLRDPGGELLAGASVADLAPPPLRRRGAAPFRGAALASVSPVQLQLQQRGFVRGVHLRAMGLPTVEAPVVGDWHVDPSHWEALTARVGAEVDQWLREHPLEPGMPAAAVVQRLRLPDPAVAGALVARAGLVIVSGRIQRPGVTALPGRLEAALASLVRDLRAAPFAAPEAKRLAELGLGARELAAAVRAGRLVKVAEGIVLLPGAVEHATRVLVRLQQPFTLSQARQALETTRRVAVPLLELLDRIGVTERLPDSTRRVTAANFRVL